MKKTISKIFKTGICLLSIVLLLPNMVACNRGVDAGSGSGTGAKKDKIKGMGETGAFLEKEVTLEDFGIALGAPVLTEDGSLVQTKLYFSGWLSLTFSANFFLCLRSCARPS